MIAAETIGRLNFCSHVGPFGLFVSAFISVPFGPLFMLPEGIVVLGGVIVPLLGMVFVHGIPFLAVVCAPGLLELTGFAFVFAGVLGETGGALVLGVVDPVVPVPAAVFVVVLFVQFVAEGVVGVVVVVVVVVGVVGGFVLWAKAGAVSPAARLAADARPRILAPRVIRLILLAGKSEMPKVSYPCASRIMKSRSQAGLPPACPGWPPLCIITVCAPHPSARSRRPASGNGGSPLRDHVR